MSPKAVHRDDEKCTLKRLPMIRVAIEYKKVRIGIVVHPVGRSEIVSEK